MVAITSCSPAIHGILDGVVVRFFTLRREFPLAIHAIAASNLERCHYSLTGLEVCHLFAHRIYDAAEFVSEDVAFLEFDNSACIKSAFCSHPLRDCPVPCSRCRSDPQIVLPVTLTMTSVGSMTFGFGASTELTVSCSPRNLSRVSERTKFHRVLAVPGQSLHSGAAWVGILLPVPRRVCHVLLGGSISSVANGLLDNVRCLGKSHFDV